MSKRKASFKGLLFLLLIIVIIGGVIAAVILWPRGPENIKKDINDQVAVVLKEDGEFLTNLNNYSEYAVDYKASSQVANNSISSVQKIYKTLSVYFEYMSYTFENADFTHYEANDVKNAQTGLKDASAQMNTISQFLKMKNDSLTIDGYNTKVYKATDAKLVWENLRVDIKESFEDYYKATSYLAKVYSNNINKGVYSNGFAKETINGVSYYLNFFQKDFENLGSTEYMAMANNFSNYVVKYLGKNKNSQRIVANYLTSTTIQDSTKVLSKFGELIKGYSLETLVLDKLGYSAELFTTEQIGYVDIGVKFFKGEIAWWRE